MKRVRILGYALVAATLLPTGLLEAQASQPATSSPPSFAPSVALMGSVGSNPQRVPGGSAEASFFAAAMELPFRVRSPRWTFNLTYRPAYQYYRDDDSLTTLDHTGSFALHGVLSPRTRLIVEGDAYASNELRGLDATDVVLPRARQVRGDIEAVLDQQISSRDALTFTGRYRRLAFPDGELLDSNAVDVGVGYGRAVSSRVTATLSAGGRLASFETGLRARSLSALAGGRFQVGRHTRLDLEGGLLWIQQDVGSGWQASDRPGFTLGAGLDHQIDRVGLRLRAERDMGTTSGLGQPTLRDRVVGSASWASNRWQLVGLAGYSRNAALDSAAAATPALRTVSACGRGVVRVNRVLAMVGTVLYAHQLGEFVGALPATDTFRVSLGVRLQANGVPLGVSASRVRFDSIGRSARATC